MLAGLELLLSFLSSHSIILCRPKLPLSSLFVITKFQLVLQCSDQHGLVLALAWTPSGVCAGADVLAREDESFLQYLEAQSHLVLSQITKRCLVNMGILPPLAVQFMFGVWHGSSAFASPWALLCWAIPVFNCFFFFFLAFESSLP